MDQTRIAQRFADWSLALGLLLLLLLSLMGAGCAAENGTVAGTIAEDAADAANPEAGDPIAGDPIAGDPIAGDPQSGDPEAGRSEADDPAGGYETWDAAYIGKMKVGYVHTKVQPREENGREVLDLRVHNTMTLLRYGEPMTQTVLVETTETRDGQLLRFRTEVDGGPEPTVTTGRVEGDSLILEVETKGKKNVSKLPWKKSYRGPFAAEDSLRQKPMESGETREFEGLVPIFNVIGKTRLVARSIEATPLLDGTRSLQRIDSTLVIGAVPIKSIVWIDEQGNLIKNVVPSMQHVAYRTTKEEATSLGALADGGNLFDLGTSTVAPLRPAPDSDLHAARSVVLRPKIEDQDPAEVFPASFGQRLAKDSQGKTTITLLAVRPGTGSRPDTAGRPADPEPGDEYSQPNNFIQSDDPRIVQMAGNVEPGQQDPWKLVCALERHVEQSIQEKNFSQAFATAAEVAQSLEGDCTEHAVLLAALCRARQVPSRVAIGLVYFPQAKGFAYHMWTEAWVADRWIPLDGTMGRGGTGAGHLKLAHSSLRGANAYTAFLPVLSVLGRLELELVEIQPNG